ncbi:MAG: hypothetical protein AAFY35_12555 [Pseudomonadota bacterium]
MTNAVLLYDGNVCSTPMIDYARNFADVTVPIREHLDYYKFKDTLSDAEFVAFTSRELGAIFDRVMTPFLQHHDVNEFRSPPELPSKAECEHVFFKWRLPPSRIENIGPFRDVFEKAEARPVTLLRRSVAEQSLKVVLSKKFYGNIHPQFAMRVGDFSDEVYEDYMARQAEVLLTLEEDDIQDVIAFASSFVGGSRRIREDFSRFFPGHDLPIVIAEHVFAPGLQVPTYERVMSRILGAPVAFHAPLVAEYRKSGLNLEHCANHEEVLAHPELVELDAKHQDLLSKGAIISKA